MPHLSALRERLVCYAAQLSWKIATPPVYTLTRLPNKFLFFFLNDPAPPEISPLSLHGALPIWIALVIASCSGGGGAALSRRNYGETIAHLTEATRYPYQFAANYAKYANQVDRLPVDGHMLVALMAPRAGL